jgi:hypothetical protein
MTETDADASPGERTQPLTFGQRARLLSNCWPFVAVLAITGGSQCYGRFQQLGRMRMSKNAHFREAVTGAHHRVVYSPVSRIVWTVEPYVNPPGTGLDRFRAKP